MKARVLIVVACLQVMPAVFLQGCKVKMRVSDAGADAAPSTASESVEQTRPDSTPSRDTRDGGANQAGAKAAGGSGGTAGRARGSAAGETAGTGGVGASGSGGGATTTEPVEICRVERPASSPANSTIWMVVDGSGSMVEMLGEKSRWVALREALLDNMSGVIRSLPKARWGLALYDGPLPGGGVGTPLPDGGVFTPSLPPATTCPRLVSVDPKPDNFAAINAAYALDPLGGSTPTDTAIAAVSAKILAGSTRVPDSMPTLVVLATDGAPNDFCETASSTSLPRDVRPDVIAAVQKLAQAGVKTYVISLAGDDTMLTAHLNQVAQAGGTGKPAFVPSNKTQLIDALRQIVATEPNCDVMLTREIDPLRACDGSVEIAGKDLTCNGADGFGLRDQTTVRLAGSACTTYKTNPASLHVSYPCDALR